MRSAPLPPPAPPGGIVVAGACWTLPRTDPLARHKTLNYWSRRLAQERGRAKNADEVLFSTSYRYYWEGSRTNLFLIRGNELITTGLGGPVLPGIMRALVLELALRLTPSLVPAIAESGISHANLLAADEVFLTNAVRGIIPVGRIMDPMGRKWPAPGPVTCQLRDRVEEWFQQEGSKA
jgi:branched-subunit amino acid aminotransferase/4-amino-4-deoxychorismate lyase